MSPSLKYYYYYCIKLSISQKLDIAPTTGRFRHNPPDVMKSHSAVEQRAVTPTFSLPTLNVAVSFTDSGGDGRKIKDYGVPSETL